MHNGDAFTEKQKVTRKGWAEFDILGNELIRFLAERQVRRLIRLSYQHSKYEDKASSRNSLA